jgi:Tol biopolymer transport system component
VKNARLFSRLILILAAVAAYVYASGEAPARRVPTVEDLFAVKSPGAVRISPDGRWVAYTVTEADFKQDAYVTHIWLADPATGDTFQLTRGDKSCTGASWSPDGTRLAFVSNRSGMPPQIYVMNADGSGVQLRSVAVTGDRTPAWSPDGSLIAFSRRVSGGSYQLFVMEQSGVRPRLLTGAYLSDAPLNPDWSPDSFEIVFSFGYCDFYYGCSSELAVLEIIGAETRILVTGGEPNVSDPAWRP